MLLKWLPWKFLVQRAARAYGIIDPITWLARMRRFAQPSEVAEPLDLLRAGIVFHARGMINTRAIQNNLDWVWPYWVERQFNPGDNSFIPRAFSMSHINLTHRNWTGVGQPGVPVYPLVDPRGLVTPLYDGWSIDCWIITEDGRFLLPSRMPYADQYVDMRKGWVVETRLEQEMLALTACVYVDDNSRHPKLSVDLQGQTNVPGWLIAAVRPYNPEGVQFIHRLKLEAGDRLRVNNETLLLLDPVPARALFSTYDQGDVFHQLHLERKDRQVRCPVGMATGALFFGLPAGRPQRVRIRVDLADEMRHEHRSAVGEPLSWTQGLKPAARAGLPDERLQYLYDTAVRTLILLSAGQIVPGPYTYRRFWYRDAVMMLNAMLTLNMADRCVAQLDLFFQRQQRSGYFASQEGEWDSNGQVLWLFDRLQRAAPDRFKQRWMKGILKGADWIRKKRLVNETGLHAGMLPAGFSAEHLGPNDYYYWDDFWSIAGLYGAGRLAALYTGADRAGAINAAGRDLEKATFNSIERIPPRRSRWGIPASPYRRMDAGAIGSMVADYPLQLTTADDARIKTTAEYLMDHCFFNGGFFQDMIHSGINAYLTLAIAQTLLRCGDRTFRPLVETVARLASSTGQWPEAIHPATLGGCMGDGHHGWASAEWVLMIRNCFIREEAQSLIVGSGLFGEWLLPGRKIFFGPTLTRFGSASVDISVGKDGCRVDLQSSWNREAPLIMVQLPGFEEKEMAQNSIQVPRKM